MKKIPNNIFFDEVTRLIEQGEAVTITVRGTSMTPFLRDGRDKVILTPFEDADLARGAVVLFRHKERHILHRIIRRRGNSLEIQGDALFTTETATVTDVVAVVKEIVRPSGRVIRNGSVCWRYMWVISARRNGLRKLLHALKHRMMNKKL
ncbi:MAG: S24/S26 family peptidase [Rikenellaceae bacterium]|jgi:signal peptidase I|nr:S24/S26 family peptidase [Rikenellaceae bacterium]